MRRHRMTEKDAIVRSGILGIVVLLLLIWAIRPFSKFESENKQTEQKTASGSAAEAQKENVKPSETPVVPVTILNKEGKTLADRINTPEGYQREKADKNSLSTFLRNYSMKKEGSPVLLYNGNEKENQEAHFAIFKLPLENEDLQQCADSVMRVYAEYFWKTKQQEKISFRLTDGFQAEYTKWREGYRIQPGTTKSSWVSGGVYDSSYKNFKKYIRIVFAYASTISMKAESTKIPLSQIKTGDIFLQAGSPGHVVMVVDMCKNADGKKAFLLAQGYMPAQEFHVLKNPANEENPWYYEEEVSYPFKTPEFTFKKGSLRRLQYEITLPST